MYNYYFILFNCLYNEMVYICIMLIILINAVFSMIKSLVWSFYLVII
ncbi:hypothetical protein BN1423_490009 [Carnobacterium maltaromaticum]|nr:hypothetical protein BN1423_490009 [Carnobacterium maltaromaticum]